MENIYLQNEEIRFIEIKNTYHPVFYVHQQLQVPSIAEVLLISEMNDENDKCITATLNCHSESVVSMFEG